MATKFVKKHKWFIDTKNIKSDKVTDIVNPLGYNLGINLSQDVTSKERDSALIVKRSWEIALGPLKKIPMNMFIMYMSGNSISLFPIMVIGMLLIGPIKALLTIKSTFNLIEGNQSLIQKFVYFIGNIATILLALYKCSSMGLLPIYPSDWLSFIDVPQQTEYSGGGFPLY